jgi:hypothetical protein
MFCALHRYLALSLSIAWRVFKQRLTVPLAKIYAPSDVAPEHLEGLADVVHESLVGTCGVPPNDRFELLLGLTSSETTLDPNFPNVSGARMPLSLKFGFCAVARMLRSSFCTER